MMESKCTRILIPIDMKAAVIKYWRKGLVLISHKDTAQE